VDTITKEQEAEIEKLEKDGWFREAVKNAYNHIVITDDDGKILYANQATQRITGYPHSEIIGSTPRLWGKQMPLSFYKKLWHCIKEERNPFIGQVTNKRKNGEKYEAHVTVSPIIKKDGELIGFVGIEEEAKEYK